MLWNFELENFYSVRENQVLDLRVDLRSPQHPMRLVAPLQGSDDRLTLVAVIFGANASGKSTVLRGLAFLVSFVRGALNWDTSESAPFLSFQCKTHFSKQTRFYVEFDSDLIGDEPHCLYSYELVLEPIVSGDKNTHIVAVEELRFAPKGRFRRLFRREKDRFLLGNQFGLPKNDMRLTYVKPTGSTIATLAQFNHDLSNAIISNLGTVQTNVGLITHGLASYDDVNTYYQANSNVFDNLRKSISMMDLGIEDIELIKSDKGLEARFIHSGQDVPLAYLFESDGTKNFYRLFPAINYALETGGIAIMDEMDRDIHPLLLPEIVGWFKDPNINKNNAQLIMSCHNATLLEHLIKEEVYFTEKDKAGATKIYGLKDIIGVRRDDNLYAKYLSGVFSAVPRIG